MTASPVRVQLSRKKGFRLPERTKVVARPSRWGNPFRAREASERGEAVRRYENWLHSDEAAALRADALKCLRGYNLACWCPLDGPCHADVLLRLANQVAT